MKQSSVSTTANMPTEYKQKESNAAVKFIYLNE